MNETRQNGLFIAVTAVMMATAGPTAAEEVNLDTMLDALVRPAPLTRSLSAAPTGPTGTEAEFLRSLPTRGLTIEARQDVVEIATARDLPAIDLDINFDFNSDSLRADVIADVVTIGRALTDPALADYRIMVAGHTDGVGSAAYNQDLSERRAETVRAFLIEAFDIPEGRLVAVGFGFEQLANPADPAADENRRVELINLEVDW